MCTLCVSTRFEGVVLWLQGPMVEGFSLRRWALLLWIPIIRSILLGGGPHKKDDI